MGKTEPDVEILELAIAREIEAYQLYTKMSDLVQDHQMKEVLTELAKEELGHKERLELELMKLGIVVASSAGKTAFERAQADLDETTFQMDYKDLLLFAIKKERQSLRLYIELAAMARDKVSCEMLLTLAEDEAMHEARFEVEYNILMRKQTE